MSEMLGAVMSGIGLVLLSLIGGGIVYLLVRDFVKRSLGNKD
jgi:hypothetical protein